MAEHYVASAAASGTTTASTGAFTASAGDVFIAFAMSVRKDDPSMAMTTVAGITWTAYQFWNGQWAFPPFLRVYVGTGTAGGTVSAVTLTVSSGDFCSLLVVQATGLAAASVVDQAPINATGGSNTAVNGTPGGVATGVLSQADEFVLALGVADGTVATWTPTVAGFTQRQAFNQGAGQVTTAVQTKTVAATTSIQPGWTIDTARNWGVAVLTLKGTSGSPYTLSANAGGYAVAGSPATLVWSGNVNLQLSAGSYGVTGHATTLTYRTAGASTTPLTFNPGTSLVAPSGWAVYPAGGVTVVVDPDFTGASCLNFPFPIGFVAGTSPAYNNYYTATLPQEQWWKLQVKISNPWQNHPTGLQKLIWFFCNSAGDALLGFHFANGQCCLHWVNEFGYDGAVIWNPNIANPPYGDAVTLGVVHTIKVHVKTGTSAGSPDSVVEWWLDGVKQASYTAMQFPSYAAAPFVDFNNQPYWGGAGGSKTENDYVRTSNLGLYASDPDTANAIQLASGAYSVAGHVATLTYTPKNIINNYALSLTSGVYGVTGRTTTQRVARVLALTSGAYPVTGSVATLAYHPTPPAAHAWARTSLIISAAQWSGTVLIG